MTDLNSLTPSDRQQPCLLCQNSQFLQVARLDRRGHPLTTVLCPDCGLVSHEVIPDDQQLLDYYAREYREDYHGEFTPSPYRVLREWKRGQALLSLLANQLKPADRVLEIGSGIGCTVKSFDLAGFRASGIEPGEGFCRFSGDQLNADVKQKTLEELVAGDDQQLVLLVHVLEHFNDPARSLRTVHQLLANNGLCYLEVPNFAAPHAAPGRQFHFAHIYNYTADTLAMLAESSGFVLQQQLSQPGDKNLQMLFRKTAGPARPIQLPDNTTSRDRSLQALSKYNRLTYHLRWRYLRDRLGTIISHRADRWRAARRLARLLERCQATAVQPLSQKQAA
jgi:SAM-dependent methyltransferase